MGSTQSIKDTPLGESCIGKQFKTTLPVCYYYCGRDKTHGICKWNNESTIINPGIDSFEIEVKSSIQFEIIDIIKTRDITGSNIKIIIKLLNNITDIGTIRERDPSKYIGWITRKSINDMTTYKSLMYIRNILHVQGIECIFNYTDFGLIFPKSSYNDIDVTGITKLQGNKLIII